MKNRIHEALGEVWDIISARANPEHIAAVERALKQVDQVRGLVNKSVEQVQTLPRGVKPISHQVKIKVVQRAVQRDILGGIGEIIQSERSNSPDENAGFGVYRLMPIPGVTNVLISTDPEINHELFLNSEAAFGRDPKQLDVIVGSSALSEDPTTEAWRQKRRAIDMHLHQRLRKIHQQAMTGEINARIDELRPGDLVDPFVFSQKISFGVMARLMVGENPPTNIANLKDELDEAALIFKNEAVQLIFNPIAINLWTRQHVLPHLYTDFTDAMHRLHAATQALITIERKKIKAGNPSNTFLTGLLTPIEDPELGTITLSDDEILGEFITLILAGSVTTANTMARMMHERAKHPEIDEKIWEENGRFLAEFEGDINTFHDLTPQELPYTFATLCETLRIYPPAALTIRRVNRDIIIHDVEFQKNDMVIIDIYHAQVDERVFPDPFTFNPDNFKHGPLGLIGKQKTAYKPFGFGPTVCPGRNFALQESVWVPLALRRKGLHFASAGYPDPIPSGDVTMEPKKGYEYKLLVKAKG